MSVVAYDCILGSGNNLRQVRNTTFSPNVELFRERAGGATAASLIGVLSANPQVSLRTGDVAGVIGFAPVGSGLWIPTGTVTIPFSAKSVGGAFAAGASHPRLSGTRALAVARSFSAAHNDANGANADVLVQLLSADGLTAPVTVGVNQSLAASSVNALFRMGPVVVNGAQLQSVTNFTVNTGLNIEVEGFDGEPYNRNAYLQTEIDPSISITFLNFDVLATYGPLFAALTSATAYLRKNADGGVTVADATAQHCSFTAGAGLVVNEEASAEAQQKGNATVVLQTKTLTASAATAVTLP